MVQTCAAAPEQYDVYRGNTLAGSIRVRHGCLSAEAGAVKVHEAAVDGDACLTSGERYSRLAVAVQAIHAHLDGIPGCAFHIAGAAWPC